MAFLVFGLFWMVTDRAPWWVMVLFVAFSLVENDWRAYAGPVRAGIRRFRT
jgi:hypothetical protein